MSNIARVFLGTYTGISPYLQCEQTDQFEGQVIVLRSKKNGSQLQWTKRNTHLFSSIKGTPIWIPLNQQLNKINPLDEDLVLFVETKGKIDIFDYIKELKNLIKPEMFTILKTGLCEIIWLKDE